MAHPSFAHLTHRPWPLPPGRWTMTQTWSDLLFAHWPVPVEVLRPLIPDSLEIDTFEGVAWLGVVPFQMSGVRPRLLPPVPGLSDFPELNVRTYVVPREGPTGKPGVWFFSLEAASRIAVKIARSTFHLPYFHAAMRIDRAPGQFTYSSRRTHRGAPPAEFEGAYAPIGEVRLAAAGTLDHWLTERYALYSVDGRGRLCMGEIHHAPWPLQPAWADITTNTMAAAAGITLPPQPPLLHFAKRLDVAVWNLRCLEG